MSTVSVNVDHSTIEIDESNNVTFFPSDPVNMHAQRLVNVGAPQGPDDAATVRAAYEAALTVGGMTKKENVKAATSGSNIDLATGGLLVIDGYQTLEGDRVLCKDQTAPEENCYYYASAGTWLRTADMQTGSDFVLATTSVDNGTVNAGLAFSCAVYNPIIVGTDPVPVVPFSFDLVKLKPGSNITFSATAAGQDINMVTPLNDLPVATGDVSVGGNKITDLALPTSATDAASKGYVDSTGGGDAYLANDQTFTGANTFTQPIDGDLAGNAATATEAGKWTAPRTINLAGKTTGSTAIDGSADVTLTTAINASLTDLSAPTADFSFGSHKLTNLAAPTVGTDATNVTWVDGEISGFLSNFASSYALNANAFGINGGLSVIEFLQLTQTVNANSFSVELHVMSYQNSNDPTTPNTYNATYQINAMRNQTGGAWQILQPTSGSHTKNDTVDLYPQIEIKVTGLVMNIRERRKNFSVNPGFMDIGYRCLVKSANGSQLFQFINASSDPEPAVVYDNNVLNTKISNAIDSAISIPANGQPLSYNSATNKWVNNWVAPMVSAYFFNAQTLTSGVSATLILDGVLWDTLGDYNAATGTFTATVAGYYIVDGCSQVSTTSVLTAYTLAIYQNAGLAAQGSFAENLNATKLGSTVSKTLLLNVGDTVRLNGLAFRTGAGNITLSFSTFTISFLRPL